MALRLAESESANYSLPAQGTHLARCIMVCDLGYQKTTFGPKLQVRVAFELLKSTYETGEGEVKPHVIGQNYTNSSYEKSNLMKHLSSWLGDEVTRAGTDEFDLLMVVGRPCMVNVIHNQSGDKTYANIASVVALPEGVECPEAVNELIQYSTEDHDDIQFSKLPDWLKEKVNREGISAVDPTAPHPNSQHPSGPAPGPDLADYDDKVPW